MECGWNEDMNGESFGCKRMNRLVVKVIIMLFVCFALALLWFSTS